MVRYINRSKGNTVIYLTIAFLVIALVPLLAWLRVPYLLVENAETGKTIWAAPLAPGEQFRIRYIHSVNLMPVYELYAHSGNDLVLDTTWFRSWGAGLGYMGEGILGEENGWTIIKEMNRHIGTIPLRVGTIAEHTLLYRGKEIRLREYVPAQTLVHIRVNNRIHFP